jgi:hypothetical protein
VQPLCLHVLQHLLPRYRRRPQLPNLDPRRDIRDLRPSLNVAPAASILARDAVTVSPAPTTSYTSRATVGTRAISPCADNNAIPRSPSVSRMCSTPSRCSVTGTPPRRSTVDLRA